MSILGGLFRQSATSDLRHPTAWLLDALGAGRKTASGTTVTAGTALTLPVFYSAIRNLSEDVAKVPLRLMRDMGDTKERADDLPLYEVLHDAPNPEMSSMAFRETMNQWAISEGCGFAEVVRDGPDVTALWPIHPSRVRMVRDDNGDILWRVRSNWTDESGRYQEQDVDIPDADMFVLHGLGNDGIRGYPVVRLMAEAIGAGIAMQTYGGNFFGGSTNGSAVLKMTQANVTEEVKENLRRQWEERYSGPDGNRKPIILPPGWDFSRIDVNPDEAQAIESRKFQVEDLARALRMPLSKLGAGAPSAGEREAIDYVADTLMPWFVRWEQEIRRKLIRASDRATLYATHVVQGLMRGDHAARAAFYNTLFHVGSFSPNDIRKLEDLNPIEGGDTYFAPMNMIPLDAAGDFAKAQIQKSAAAPQTTQRNPTDQGGGADNAPKESDAGTPRQMAASEVRAIAMGFFAPICQRLAVKEARAVETAAKKGASHFASWAGPFYESMAAEARDHLTEPLVAYGRLKGGPAAADFTAWYNASRRQASDAFASGMIERRVAVLATDEGPAMAEWIVEGK
jgi:HK97 family phage portal protein